jgi:hypothetical protein
MSRYLLVLPFVLACGGAETPPADSSAAAPAALTEADVAGAWSGTLMPEGSDSVLANWSLTAGSGTYRLTTTQTPTDTVSGTYVLEADSSRYASGPFADPNAGGTMMKETGTVRYAGTTMSGTGVRMLAANDSVVLRYRFTGTKNP